MSILPLEGVRICDLSIITAGANATSILADFGAEVIKVESIQAVDPFRHWGAIPTPEEYYQTQAWNHSPTFAHVNRNKRGITLDLKSEMGRELLYRLVKQSNAFVENFRVGVVEKLGAGYETLKKINPNIVYVSLSGQGRGGPESLYSSYGSTLEVLSGLTSITGYPDGQPIITGPDLNYPDQLVSSFAAGMIAAALYQQKTTGRGAYLDFAQSQLTSLVIGEHLMAAALSGGSVPAPVPGTAGAALLEEVCRCQGDDEWVAMAVASPAEYTNICDLLGLGGSANEQDVRNALSAWAAKLTKRQAAEQLNNAGVDAVPVINGADRLVDPYFQSRGAYVKVKFASGEEAILKGTPIRLSDTPGSIRTPAPDLGQDNDEVLTTLCGVSPAELRQLREEKVIGEIPVKPPAA